VVGPRIVTNADEELGIVEFLERDGTFDHNTKVFGAPKPTTSADVHSVLLGI
jgi:hypothetical protein